MGDGTSPPGTDQVRTLASASGRRWPTLLLAAAGGISLSLLLFLQIAKNEEMRLDQEFRRDALERSAALRAVMVHGLDALTALESLYASSTEVDRSQFHTFTRHHLSHGSGIRALEWIPRVAADEREAFERSTRAAIMPAGALAEALPRFEITEMAEQGKTVRASDRAEYFPVAFVEPYNNNESVLGFDLGSHPDRLEALTRARDRGEVVATPALRLIQETGQASGFLVMSPIYDGGELPDSVESRQRLLRGFVLAEFDIHGVVGAALEDLEPRGVDILVYDAPVPTQESLLYYHASRLRRSPAPSPEEALSRAEAQESANLRVADREWLVVSVSAPEFWTLQETWARWSGLAGGLLLTFLAVSYLVAGARRETRFRAFATELLQTQDSLEKEMAEREWGEQELRSQKALHTQILDSLPVNVFLKDSEGRLEFLNASARRLLGAAGDEALGKTDFDLFPEPIARTLRSADLDALAAGAAISREETVVVDGQEVHLLAGKTAIKMGGFAEPHLLGFSIDIRELKKAETALRDSEARFRALVESMSSGVAVCEARGDGADFVISDFNRAAEAMEGIRREEVIGRSVIEVFPWVQEIGLLSLMQRVWKTGEPEALPEAVRRNERGESWQEHYVYRLPSREVVTIYADVTERRRLEAHLLHAQKMEAVGRLAGGIAHDFNNLLQVVLGGSDLLLQSSSLSEEDASLLREIREQALRGARLARRLLVFSRREASEAETFDLGEAVTDAAVLTGRLLRENIVQRLELTGEKLPVRGDRGQIEQVLMNLAVNAADAMPNGGTLTIRSGARDAGEVWFSVGDTGGGVSPEVVDNIFEPYFTTKSPAEGTGLGLAVVDGIVTMHGGHIETQNRPGKGLELRIVLPRYEAAPISPPLPPSHLDEEIPGDGSRRVLLVEDQALVRKVIANLLTSLSYEFATAQSGAEARHQAKVGRFDVLLSDVVLPDVSGIDLARELQGAWPDLKVLLVSGYADELVQDKIPEQGWGFLQKPFQRKELARELRVLLGTVDRLGERGGRP